MRLCLHEATPARLMQYRRAGVLLGGWVWRLQISGGAVVRQVGPPG